jgi:6-phosphofructokinase 1
VAVIAEGVALDISPDDLADLKDVERDAHGHVRLAEVNLGDILKSKVSERVRALGLKTTISEKNIGYELRCADPIPFDAEYTRDLGFSAVKFLLSPDSEKFGAIISFDDGRMVPLPFDKMLNPETRRMQVRRVNVDGEAYECACAYMIRLEREDFEDARQLAKLAAIVKMTPEDFYARFGYLAGLK